MTINYQQPFQPYYPNQNPLFMEQSYIENILRLNTGKQVSVYMNFEGSQWGSKIFRGELLEAGKDHIIPLAFSWQRRCFCPPVVQ